MGLLYVTDDCHSHALSGTPVGGQVSDSYVLDCWVRRDAGMFDMKGVFVRNNKGSGKLPDMWEGLTWGFDDMVGGTPVSTSRITVVSYRSSANYSFIQATAAATIGQWYHVVAIFRNTTMATQRELYIDGVLDGSSLTGINSNLFTRVSFGAIERTATTRFASCSIAYPAIWEGDLYTHEIASRAAGAYPWQVRPANLRTAYSFATNPPRENFAGPGIAPPLIWTTLSAPAPTSDPPVGTELVVHG